MTDQLQALTGAGGPISIGGKLLTLRQLDFDAISNIRAWAKDKIPRPMKLFVEEMKEIQPLKEFDPEGYEKIRADLLLKAHENHQIIEAGGTPSNVMEFADSNECLAYMIWLSCKEDHPDESFESILSKLKTEKVADIKAKMDRINLAWMPKKEVATNGPPDQRAPLPE